jgi:RNA polymerase sigma factor (sigma-70 family)
MARYRFWVHDRDRKGRPIDERMLKAADEIAPDLARYRQEEIDCESTSNSMLQSAVEAASQATHAAPIQNPPGYLTSVYKHIVDRFLARKKRIVPVEDSFLEDLANADSAGSSEDEIHNHLLIEKLLNAMDDDTRLICRWRLEGYSMQEIANELGITPNCLSVRYTRGLKKAAKDVLEKNQGQVNNGRRRAV